MTWVMWNLVSIRLETGLASVLDRYSFRAKHTIASKSFWTHPMVLQGEEAQVKARFGPFRDSANLDAR
jgi:hypothetical protein